MTMQINVGLKQRVGVYTLLTIAFGMTGVGSLAAQGIPTDEAVAFHRAAVKAHAALAKDAGKFWGARLDSVAWLGVDGKTMLLTTAPTIAGYTMTNGVWEGPLPTTITPSNTSVKWDGRTWAMILLPMQPDSLVAERLLIHEAMHVLQPSVLPAPPYDETGAGAAILDEAAGRTWLRLEWKALATALRSTGAARDSAVHDALLFRAARYAISAPDEVNRERALDIKEGLPEYTAWKLSGSPRSEFTASIDSAPAKMPSFVRAFVYFTGPAYAMLLDDYTNGAWRHAVAKRLDLQSMLADAIADKHFKNADMIKSALMAKPSANASGALASAAHVRAAAYGGPTIVAEENQRWAEREKQLAQYRTDFLVGPTVRLRPHPINVSFDPRRQASLGESGTVMANLVWKAADGSSLTAPAGALINQSWTELRVPRGKAQLVAGVVKQATTIKGDGWTLVLEAGWTVTLDGTSFVVTPPKA